MKDLDSHKLIADAQRDAKAKKAQRTSAPRAAGAQYAALPYRLHDGFEVLLITSRETGRWVLPKGWPMRGKKPCIAAAREALEEAGVKGKIGKSAIGSYSYAKRLSDGAVLPCIVTVFPLVVERQMARWPEQGQRTLCWFKAGDATDLVEERELAMLIQAFARQMAD